MAPWASTCDTVLPTLWAGSLGVYHDTEVSAVAVPSALKAVPRHPMKYVTSSGRPALPTPYEGPFPLLPATSLSSLPCLICPAHVHLIHVLWVYCWRCPSKHDLWESCDSALFTAVFPGLGLRTFDQQWDPSRIYNIRLFSLYLCMYFLEIPLFVTNDIYFTLITVI